MKENQHNDNLERFFKANLENYAPNPSEDFWDRMGTAIPPKPPVWGGLFSKTGKWVALGILALITAVVLWFWHRDRSQIVRLKQTVAQQQQQIQEMNDSGDSPSTPPSNTVSVQEKSKVPTPNESVASASQTVVSPVVAPQKKTTASQIIERKAPIAKRKKTGTQSQNLIPSTKQVDLQIIENQLVEKSSSEIDKSEIKTNSSENIEKIVVPESEIAVPSITAVPSPIASKMTLVFRKNGQSLSVKPSVLNLQKSYPRFAVEAGGSAFRMSLGRLFQQDTFLTGRTGTSYEMGFNISYEVDSRWALQAGYQFTNLRARRLALRYNSFPIAVQKRWNWGRRSHIEGKLGASLNSLVSARTDSDGQSVKGLKPTWIGFHGGVAATWSLTDNLTLVAGPTAGFSLSPMTTGRRSWDVGLGASLRYHL